MVGTRRPDADGLALARRLAGQLVEHGYSVISGLAQGIDCAAHRGALDAGGRTWAVVGCGVDVAVAPAAARDPALVSEMVERGGVLAEVPPGTTATAQALVARDRIQSGLSAATVVVQTDLASGTMHTARFTLEQERLLVVLAPGAERSDRAGWAGNAALSDPGGCDPALLHARGRLAVRLAARRPVADLVLDPDGNLTPLLDLISER